MILQSRSEHGGLPRRLCGGYTASIGMLWLPKHSNGPALTNACSICSFVYLQPASVKAPNIPRDFEDETNDEGEASIGNPVPGYPVDGKPSSHIFDAMCSLSGMLNEVMEYNKQQRQRLGSREDISRRIGLYSRLHHWKQKLPPALDASVNYCAATCLLR